MTHIRRITHQLQKYPRDLLLTNQNIIWPLQTRTRNSILTKGMHDRQPNDQAKPFQLPETSV
ncbi:hypothetical protein SAMN03159464_06260, partial [Pseudomonas sp. NFPP15]